MCGQGMQPASSLVPWKPVIVNVLPVGGPPRQPVISFIASLGSRGDGVHAQQRQADHAVGFAVDAGQGGRAEALARVAGDRCADSADDPVRQRILKAGPVESR